MGKQLTARNIAEDFGETSRHWTKLAEAGLVPGASRPSGKAPWLFEVAVFKAWHEAGQPPIPKPAPQPASTKASKTPARRPDPETKRKAKSAEIDAGIAALVRGALEGR